MEQRFGRQGGDGVIREAGPGRTSAISAVLRNELQPGPNSGSRQHRMGQKTGRNRNSATPARRKPEQQSRSLERRISRSELQKGPRYTEFSPPPPRRGWDVRPAPMETSVGKQKVISWFLTRHYTLFTPQRQHKRPGGRFSPGHLAHLIKNSTTNRL